MPGPKTSQLPPDRVTRAQPGEPAEMWIDSAFEKSHWMARKSGGFTQSEHPGTAVRLDGRIYEIFSAEPASEPGYAVRYGLKSWDQSHTIRRIIDYTPESSAQAAEEFTGELRREWLRAALVWFFPLAGFAPDPVQRRWEEEAALPMAVAAAASCLVEIAVFAALVHTFGKAPHSRVLLWSMDYLGVDGFARLLLVVISGKARGMFLISAPYLLWEAATRPERRVDRAKQADALDELDEVIRRPSSGHLTIRSLLFDSTLYQATAIRFEGEYFRPLARSVQGRGLKRRWVYEFEKIEGQPPGACFDYTRPRPPVRQAAAVNLTRRYDRAHAMGLIWGLYPARAQSRLEALYSFPCLQMTRATAGLLLAGSAIEAWFGWMLNWPPWAFAPPAYFVLESLFRLARAARDGRPVGSLAGLLLRPFLHSREP